VPTDREIDPEFLELFIEEAKDEIAKLQQFFPLWDENPQDHESLTNVRRSFHTLKGSGRMVGAQLIGEFAWAIENLLNRVINKTLDRTPDIMALLREAVAAVPELVEQLETGRDPRIDIVKTIERAHTLAGGRPAGAPAPGASYSTTPARANAAPAQPARAPEPPTLTATAVVDPPEKKTAPTAPLSPSSADLDRPPDSAEQSQMDPVLHEIYAKETAGHLATIREFIDSCELIGAPYPVTEDLHRSCHTLSGTAKTAGARHGIKIAEPLNRYVRKLYDNSIALPEAGLDVLRDAVNAIQQVIDHIDADTGFFASHDFVVQRLNDLDHAVDAEISRLAETLDVGGATLEMPAIREDIGGSTSVFAEDRFPAPAVPASNAQAEDDVIELDPIDANSLDMLNWSFDNFPAAPAPSQPEDAAIDLSDFSVDVPLDDDATDAVEEPPDTQRALKAPELVVETAAWAAEFEPQSLPQDPPTEPVFVEPADEGETVRSLKFVAVEKPALADVDEAMLAQAFADMPDIAPETTNIQRALPEDVTAASELALPNETLDKSEPALDASEPEEIVMEAVELEAELAPEAELQPEREPEPEPQVVAAAPAPVPAAPAPQPAHEPIDEAPELDEDFDPDVAAIFTEEATELLETAETSLGSWLRDRNNNALVFELKRVVHTLKGGARMAGLRAMGDLSHELETLMGLVEAGQVPAEPQVFDVLQASLDELHSMRDVVANGGRCKQARQLLARIRALSGHGPAVEAAAPAPQAAPTPVQAPESTPAQSVAASELVIESQPAEDSSPTATAPVLMDFVETRADEDAIVALDDDGADEIEVEFGADELGAAAPRASLGLEDSQKITVEPPKTALDVAALAPELPLDTTSEPAPAEIQPAPVLPPGREQVAPERQEFARVDADLLDTLLNNAGEVSIFRSRLEQ
jgi:chemosensory pili system protein ChpA (sensor histidine kinase/response regulator)